VLYSILIYTPEDKVNAMTQAEDNAHVAQHLKLHEKLVAENRLGPVMRLMPTRKAVHYRSSDRTVVDGPFAETKEQLLGLYIVDCQTQEEALDIARSLPTVGTVFEIRPVELYFPDRIRS
jgi:hypothetical protein